MALQSVSFNGSSTLISCGVVPTGGLSTVTVEAWVYFDSLTPATQGIVSKDGATSQDWALFTENNTDITFRFKRAGVGTVRVGTYINGARTGRWQHVVGVYDGGHVYVYVDGVVGITANTATGTVNTSAQAVEIGRYSGGGHLNGKVGYVSISNTARYTAAFTPPSLPRAVDANTLAQWNFTNGSGVTVKNVGYNTAYNGTITSGSWSTSTPFFATHVDSGHLIELKVNGVNLWGNTVKKSFRLSEAEGGKTSTVTFDIEETSSTYTFLAWTHEVVWLVDGIKEFGGYIVSVSPKVVKGTSRRVHSISCESYQSVLNHSPKLRETYVNKTSEQILTALFSAAGMSAFNTSLYVSTGGYWDIFSCNGEKLVDLVDRLAQREHFSWRIDAEKYVHFGAASSFHSPFDVTEISLANLSTTYPVIDAPEYKYDQTDVRNRIKVIGGTRVTPIIIDTFTGDGSTLIFQLTHHPVHDVLYVTIDEALQRHGVDWYVTFDDGYDCLINYRSGTIRFNPHMPPGNGSTIVVCYRQLLEFNHTCVSSASYALYGMYFDYELADPSITSEYMATEVCSAMLADYEYGRFEGSFEIERFGLHVGQEISVNFPTLGINANYTIRQVSVEVLKGEIISCQIKYGGKRPRVQQITFPSIGTGGGLGGAVPIQPGGSSGGSGGGGVPGSSWGGGEVDVVRVNQRIEAIKRTTQFNSFSDYGTATGIVLAYDNVSDTSKLLGLNNGDLHAYFDSDGGIKGGGGAVIIDEFGLRIVSPSGSPGPNQRIRFASTDGADTYAEWYTFMNLASMDSWLIVSAADHPASAHAIFNLQASAASGKYGQIYLDAIGDNNNEHATINLVADVGATSIELLADTVQVTSAASFDKGITVNETGIDSDTRMEGDTATNLFVLDAGLDAVQIGTTTPGVIADFRSSGIVLNENGADRDTRIEGDTDANLLFVDASTDRIGVGTNAPASKLQVTGEARFGSSSDYVKIDTTGRLTMNGDATQWGSIFVSPFSTKDIGASPIIETFPRGSSNNLYVYGFQKYKYTELHFFAQIPPSYKDGTEIVPIVHFSPLGNCGEGQGCFWGIDYVISGVGSVFGGSTNITYHISYPYENFIQDKHYYTILETIASEAGAIITGKVFRDGTDVNDTAEETMIFLGLEFIFEMDSLGRSETISR